jgi:hypothetical protein
MKTNSVLHINYNRLLIFIITASLIILQSCSSSLNDTYLSENILISTNTIQANLEFLASDEFEGREAASRGERLAALFISSELKKYGVTPFYNSYLQDFDLFSYSVDSNSVITLIDKDNSTTTLKYYDVYFANKMHSVSAAGKFNLVFAGYGISAPGLNYDDYASIDVSGKVVIIYDDIPPVEGMKYNPAEGVPAYAKLPYKITEAKKRNAAGIILIPSDFLLRNWERSVNYYKGDALFLPRRKPDEKEKLLALTMNRESLTRLFSGEEFSFEEIKNKKENKEPLPAFDLKKEIDIDVKKYEGIKKSYNIVGVIEGYDPLLKQEYIAVGAHYDHVGIIGEKYITVPMITARVQLHCWKLQKHLHTQK